MAASYVGNKVRENGQNNSSGAISMSFSLDYKFLHNFRKNTEIKHFKCVLIFDVVLTVHRR